MREISVIILSFNTKEYLKNLLTSIKKTDTQNSRLEVIIVDNASTDGTSLMVKKNFPKVTLVENKENLGFAQACNQGARLARGKYLLFLNSDTKIGKKTLVKMINFFEENNSVAAATCKLTLPPDKLDPACHRGFPTPWNAFCYFTGLEKLFPNLKIFSGYHQRWKNQDSVHEVEVISGAFFMIRKKIFEKLGGFDEQFFMYAEDIDLCKRIKDKGYKIFYYPLTRVIHYKKQSGREKLLDKKNIQEAETARQKTKKHFYETMKIFYEKHYEKKYPKIFKYLVLAGIWFVSKFKD